MFFSSYGSFMHKLIELYYKGEITRDQAYAMYLRDFKTKVRGRAPNPKIFKNYFTNGLEYLKGFQPLPFRVLAVEKKVDFQLDGIPFIGYIDFLGETDDGLVIVDNKSRALKPRSTRASPTKTDVELDSYLRQLYIYAAAIEQEYGTLPKKLCFNCFRTQTLIEEPFRESAYQETKLWLKDSVNRITNETDFRPDVEYFKCRHLCEAQDSCEYYELSNRR